MSIIKGAITVEAYTISLTLCLKLSLWLGKGLPTQTIYYFPPTSVLDLIGNMERSQTVAKDAAARSRNWPRPTLNPSSPTLLRTDWERALSSHEWRETI